MANNHRTVGSILKGIWTHTLSLIAQFTFPAQITTTLHRMRGVHIGKGSKITRTVLIEESRPDLITIGKNVWITSGCQILCHQRDLSYYKIGNYIGEDCNLIIQYVEHFEPLANGKRRYFMNHQNFTI